MVIAPPSALAAARRSAGAHDGVCATAEVAKHTPSRLANRVTSLWSARTATSGSVQARSHSSSLQKMARAGLMSHRGSSDLILRRARSARLEGWQQSTEYTTHAS